jgi:hypothetical protein
VTIIFSRKILFHGVTEDIERETECSEIGVSAHMGIWSVIFKAILYSQVGMRVPGRRIND